MLLWLLLHHVIKWGVGVGEYFFILFFLNKNANEMQLSVFKMKYA